jgi:hypothetical protein
MRCRLSLLFNSALVYEPKNAGAGGGGCRVSANEFSSAHGAKINFRDLTPLIYGSNSRRGGVAQLVTYEAH